MLLIDTWPDTPDSTSDADCYFLYETCLEYKPKKILEIGTLVGKSAYAMALGSDWWFCLVQFLNFFSWTVLGGS